MHISNFRPVKRTTDVVDIFAKVNARTPAKLVLVGEGPDLPKIQTKINALGLAHRVHFLGKQDDVAQVISIADLMLLPSEKESFGLVALEAMACGVPTIGSVAGGIPELVQHGKTGFLSPIGNTNDMADNALKLLLNDSLYAEFKAACLQRAHCVFDDKLITAQYEEIYYRVLGMPLAKPVPVCNV
jgi:N-acetyl-alpha-D-glucosaminyl L-malate synthase BshA